MVQSTRKEQKIYKNIHKQSTCRICHNDSTKGMVSEKALCIARWPEQHISHMLFNLFIAFPTVQSFDPEQLPRHGRPDDGGSRASALPRRFSSKGCPAGRTVVATIEDFPLGCEETIEEHGHPASLEARTKRSRAVKTKQMSKDSLFGNV